MLEGSDATSGGAGRSAPSAGADTMIEEEEMTLRCGERESRDQGTSTAPALLHDDAEKDQVFGGEKKAFVSGGDLVLSEKAANCSLLSSSQPDAGGSEVALRLEDAESGGRRVGRTWPGCSSAGRDSPNFSPGSHTLGKQLWVGVQQQIHPWVKRRLLGAPARQGKRVAKSRRKNAPTSRA